MVISKLVKEAMDDLGIPYQTFHSRKREYRKKTDNAISSETALYIAAGKEGVDVPKLLKKDNKLDELEDFKNAHATYDFGKKSGRRKPPAENTEEKSNGNELSQTNKMSKTIEKIISIGKKFGIENIDQNWIDSLAILNFIETASTKFLMDHDYSEDEVKDMKWEGKLTKLQNKLYEEAKVKKITIRNSVGSFFKNYRQVRNDQDHIAHLPTSHVPKDELGLLQKNLDIFIKNVFIDHKKYCLK